MIAPYYDHELAVYQIVLFVEMRIGDSKSPQGSRWERESNEKDKVLKKRVWRYHTSRLCWIWSQCHRTTDSTLGYLKAVIFLPNLPKAWKKKKTLINEKFIIEDRNYFFNFKSEKRNSELTLIIILTSHEIISYVAQILWSWFNGRKL